MKGRDFIEVPAGRSDVAFWACAVIAALHPSLFISFLWLAIAVYYGFGIKEKIKLEGKK